MVASKGHDLADVCMAAKGLYADTCITNSTLPAHNADQKSTAPSAGRCALRRVEKFVVGGSLERPWVQLRAGFEVGSGWVGRENDEAVFSAYVHAPFSFCARREVASVLQRGSYLLFSGDDEGS